MGSGKKQVQVIIKGRRGRIKGENEIEEPSKQASSNTLDPPDGTVPIRKETRRKHNT
jgi:hypothetical protein